MVALKCKFSFDMCILQNNEHMKFRNISNKEVTEFYFHKKIFILEMTSSHNTHTHI